MILIGVGDLGDLWTWLHEQLQSVASLVAVEGALSTSPSVATGSTGSSNFELLLLSWLLALLVVLLVLLVLLAVDVRFRGAFVAAIGAVGGGLTRDGEAIEIDFRKSI